MFEAVFGTEMPLALRFFIAFLFVLALIGGAAYLVRRFGAGALGAAAARGRQPRLAVIDAAPVDNRRKLVLIRRDNVEHLIMIGGPSDVVVETNIVRAAPAATGREAPRGLGEPTGRPAANETAMWPPEPAVVSRPTRPTPIDEPTWSPPEPVAPVRPTNGERDRFGGMAADLSRSVATDLGSPRSIPDSAVRGSEPGAPRPLEPIAPRPLAAESRRVAAPPPPPPPPPAPPAPPLAMSSPAEEQNLADMAHRLEAALRRPGASSEPSVGESAMIKPVAEPMTRPAPPIEPPPLAARSVPASEPKVAPTDSKQGPKTVYDSLEQEMASLLGRPSGKT